MALYEEASDCKVVGPFWLGCPARNPIDLPAKITLLLGTETQDLTCYNDENPNDHAITPSYCCFFTLVVVATGTALLSITPTAAAAKACNSQTVSQGLSIHKQCRPSQPYYQPDTKEKSQKHKCKVSQKWVMQEN